MKPKTRSTSKLTTVDEALRLNSEARTFIGAQTKARQASGEGQCVPALSVRPQDSVTPRGAQVMAAIQELYRKLQTASAYSPALPDHGRGSARIALIGVLEFLSVLFPDTQLLPLALEDLLIGLVDLDRGTVIPLLKPVKEKGRRPNPLSDELFRALVAAAMTSLMRNREICREVAARDIAGRLSKLGYRLGRLPYVRIAKWREKMMTELVTENLAVQRYRLALRLVADKEPDEAARFLLDNLATLCPADFPKKDMFK